MLLGPVLRQLIEYMSQPTCSKATMGSLTTEIENVDEAIRQIETCESSLIETIYAKIHEFNREDLQKLLETRRTKAVHGGRRGVLRQTEFLFLSLL